MQSDEQFISNNVYLKFNYKIRDSHERILGSNDLQFQRNLYEIELIYDPKNEDNQILNTNVYELKICQVFLQEGSQKQYEKILYSKIYENKQIRDLNQFSSLLKISQQIEEYNELRVQLNKIVGLRNKEQKEVLFNKVYKMGAKKVQDHQKLQLNNYKNLELEDNQYEVIDIRFVDYLKPNDVLKENEYQESSLYLQVTRHNSILLENDNCQFIIKLEKCNLEDFMEKNNLQYDDYFVFIIKQKHQRFESQQIQFEEIFRVKKDEIDYCEEYTVYIKVSNIFEKLNMTNKVVDDEVVLMVMLYDGNTQQMEDFMYLELLDLPFKNGKELNVQKNMMNEVLKMKLVVEGYELIENVEPSQQYQSQLELDQQQQQQSRQSYRVKKSYKKMVYELKQSLVSQKRKQKIIETSILKQQSIMQINQSKIEKIEELVSKAEENRKVNKQDISKQHQELYNQICSCGKQSPSVKGYCLDCYENNKQKFNELFAKYLGLQEQIVEKEQMIINKIIKSRRLKQKTQDELSFKLDGLGGDQMIQKEQEINAMILDIEVQNNYKLILKEELEFSDQFYRQREKTLQELIENQTENLKEQVEQIQNYEQQNRYIQHKNDTSEGVFNQFYKEKKVLNKHTSKQNDIFKVQKQSDLDRIYQHQEAYRKMLLIEKDREQKQ